MVTTNKISKNNYKGNQNGTLQKNLIQNKAVMEMTGQRSHMA